MNLKTIPSNVLTYTGMFIIAVFILIVSAVIGCIVWPYKAGRWVRRRIER